MTPLRSLALLLVLAGGACGQCFPSLAEDFESATLAFRESDCVLLGSLPAGWTQGDPFGSGTWTTGRRGRPVGPAFDRTGQDGRFLVAGAQCGFGDAILVTPCLDLSGATTPALELWYALHGDQSAIEVESFNGFTWTPILPAVGPTALGPGWHRLVIPLSGIGPALGTPARFRIRGIPGGTSFSNPGWVAVDGVGVIEAPAPAFATNTSALAVGIDGARGDGFHHARVFHEIQTVCAPGAAAVVTLEVESSLPGAVWDLLLVAAPPIPSSAPGGLAFPDGQHLNLDLGAGFTWLSSGTTSSASPTLPTWTQGGSSSSVAIAVSSWFAAAAAVSLQGVVFDPTAALGLTLSQATRLEVIDPPFQSSVAGPAGLLELVTVDVTRAPTCWTTGIPFFGSVFEELTVSPDGRVMFASSFSSLQPVVDPTPSPFEGALGPAMIGFWTDLGPEAGGAITISSPAPDLVRIDWAGVPYEGTALPVSFAVELDCVAGTVLLTGLQGIPSNPGGFPPDAQFLGLSPGGDMACCTPPPTSTFLPTGTGGDPMTQEALYDFNDPATSGVGLPASLAAGTQSILFTPAGPFGGTYTWQAF